MSCGHSEDMMDAFKMAQIRAKEKQVEKSWLVEDEYGFYEWRCPYPDCHYQTVDMSKQAVASGRFNHLRIIHGVTIKSDIKRSK